MIRARAALFRAAATGMALGLLACQQPAVPPTAASDPVGQSPASADGPRRRLLVVPDADRLRAAFDAAFSPDSDFGGAPDPDQILAAAKTPEGRTATSIALRGKTGWVFIAPAQASSFSLLAKGGAATTAAAPVEADRLRLLAAGKTMRPPGPRRTFRLFQAASTGRTVGEALDTYARNRNDARLIPPDNSTPLLPDDDWGLLPAPPDQYPRIQLPPVVGPGVDVSNLAHCSNITPGVIARCATNGGKVWVLYAGNPFIFGCDLFAGFTPDRWFSGETIQANPSAEYAMCIGACENASAPAGIFNTHVLNKFRVAVRTPASLVQAIDALGPEEAPGFPTPPQIIGHAGTGGFMKLAGRPDGPTLWETLNGTFRLTVSEPDPGVRGASPMPSASPPSEPPTPTPAASVPPSPSPSVSTSPSNSPPPSPSASPTPAPVSLTFDWSAFSPDRDQSNPDDNRDNLVVRVGAEEGVDWILDVSGFGEIARGSGPSTVVWDGKLDSLVPPDGIYSLRLTSQASSDVRNVRIDTTPPVVSQVRFSLHAVDGTLVTYRAAALVAAGEGAALRVDSLGVQTSAANLETNGPPSIDASGVASRLVSADVNSVTGPLLPTISIADEAGNVGEGVYAPDRLELNYYVPDEGQCDVGAKGNGKYTVLATGLGCDSDMRLTQEDRQAIALASHAALSELSTLIARPDVQVALLIVSPEGVAGAKAATAIERIAANWGVGRKAEMLVKNFYDEIGEAYEYQVVMKASTYQTSKVRRLDLVTKDSIIEVKDVEKLHLSGQLKDILKIANMQNKKVIFFVRDRSTHMSKQLRDAISESNVEVRYLSDLRGGR